MRKLEPRNYQKVGIEFLKSHKRCALWDKPGMGKTFQASEAAVPPVLVTAPGYLLEQWGTFIQGQYGASVEVIRGTAAKRVLTLMKTKADWIIVNHEMFRKYNFDPVRTLIIDEAHHFRKHTAAQSQRIASYAENTEYVFELTGSPIMNQCDDLFMQLRILDPETFRSYYRFLDTFCSAVRTPWRTEIKGCSNPWGLKRVLENYRLERTYAEVGLELPDLIAQDVIVDFDPTLRKAYEEVKSTFRLRFQKEEITLTSAMAMLTMLRRMTLCRTKLEAIKGLIEDANCPVVVFCWYRESAEHLGEVLECPVITGDEQPAKRVTKALGRHKIIVATMASLSEGVDLSFARMVIYAEEDYTPGIIYQSLSRIRRHSHNNEPVRVYYVRITRSVDEVIHETVTSRVADAKKILREALM